MDQTDAPLSRKGEGLGFRKAGYSPLADRAVAASGAKGDMARGTAPRIYWVTINGVRQGLNLRQVGDMVNKALPNDGSCSLRPSYKSLGKAAEALGISRYLARKALDFYNWN